MRKAFQDMVTPRKIVTSACHKQPTLETMRERELIPYRELIQTHTPRYGHERTRRLSIGRRRQSAPISLVPRNGRYELGLKVAVSDSEMKAIAKYEFRRGPFVVLKRVWMSSSSVTHSRHKSRY